LRCNSLNAQQGGGRKMANERNINGHFMILLLTLRILDHLVA